MERPVGISTVGFTACAGARCGFMCTSVSGCVHVQRVLLGVGCVRLCVAPGYPSEHLSPRPPVPDLRHHSACPCRSRHP